MIDELTRCRVYMVVIEKTTEWTQRDYKKTMFYPVQASYDGFMVQDVLAILAETQGVVVSREKLDGFYDLPTSIIRTLCDKSVIAEHMASDYVAGVQS